jgi:Bacterial cadherin-like domain
MVTITVNCINDVPMTVADAYSANEDTPSIL